MPSKLGRGGSSDFEDLPDFAPSPNRAASGTRQKSSVSADFDDLPDFAPSPSRRLTAAPPDFAPSPQRRAASKKKSDMFDFENLPEVSDSSSSESDSEPDSDNFSDFGEVEEGDVAATSKFRGRSSSVCLGSMSPSSPGLPKKLADCTPDIVPHHFARKVSQGRDAVDTSKTTSVALLANGSRGDVQPIIALAQVLQERGFTVTVLTNYDFIDFCNSADVAVESVFSSFKAVFEKVGGIEPPPVNERKEVKVEVVKKSWMRQLENEETDSAGKAWKLEHPGCVKDPYEVLATLKPKVVLYTQMAELPAKRYESSHLAPAIAVHYASVGQPNAINLPPRPTLFATSSFVDSNLQTGRWSRVTGPWQLKEDISDDSFGHGSSLAALRRFVGADGEKPVYVGWGSMLAKGHPPIRMLGTALRALRAIGKRAVVLGGWAKLHELGKELIEGGLEDIGPDRDGLASFAAEKVFFAPHAPHSWLLQRCCCAVHHGGAGTTYAALSAGCASVVTPFFGDQFQFAQRVEQLGAGVAFLRAMPEIEHFELGSAILEAEEQSFPKELLRQIKTERGAELAADVIEGYVEDWVLNGKFKEEKAEAGKAASCSRLQGRRRSTGSVLSLG